MADFSIFLDMFLCNCRYDFTVTNWNVEEEEADAVVNKQDFPDLVLVRKVRSTHVKHPQPCFVLGYIFYFVFIYLIRCCFCW